MRTIRFEGAVRPKRWAPFWTGALLGLAVGVLLRRVPGRSDALTRVLGAAGRRAGHEPARSSVGDRISRAVDGAVEEASDRLAAARKLVLGRPDLDLAGLEALVSALPCAHDCRLRELGDGIVEVVGVCDDDEAAAELLTLISSAPGVEVVVNRVWTPSSFDPHRPAPW